MASGFHRCGSFCILFHRVGVRFGFRYLKNGRIAPPTSPLWPPFLPEFAPLPVPRCLFLFGFCQVSLTPLGGIVVLFYRASIYVVIFFFTRHRFRVWACNAPEFVSFSGSINGDTLGLNARIGPPPLPFGRTALLHSPVNFPHTVSFFCSLTSPDEIFVLSRSTDPGGASSFSGGK